MDVNVFILLVICLVYWLKKCWTLDCWRSTSYFLWNRKLQQWMEIQFPTTWSFKMLGEWLASWRATSRASAQHEPVTHQISHQKPWYKRTVEECWEFVVRELEVFGLRSLFDFSKSGSASLWIKHGGVEPCAKKLIERASCFLQKKIDMTFDHFLSTSEEL